MHLNFICFTSYLRNLFAFKIQSIKRINILDSENILLDILWDCTIWILKANVVRKKECVADEFRSVHYFYLENSNICVYQHIIARPRWYQNSLSLCGHRHQIRSNHSYCYVKMKIETDSILLTFCENVGYYYIRNFPQGLPGKLLCFFFRWSRKNDSSWIHFLTTYWLFKPWHK